MGSEIENMEERLKSLLVQLQTESGILDRIVYKGKNQHRRCLYFQYILKVRRDVRLLLSARLEEILNLFFQVLSGNKPNQTVQLLESLKKTKHPGEAYNFKERLLGVARLLSQMVEPMVMAATEISSLLARSFFMGFSLTILALLARLRVLVQQILLDTVSVFNLVSSLSQKEHSIKLNRVGIEIFREYYPSKEDVKTLECMWRKDKFVLLERVNKNEMKNQDTDCGVGSEVPLQSAKITYESIEALLGDDELGSMSTDNIEELPDPTEIKRRKIDTSTDQFIEGMEIEECKNDEVNEGSPDENITVAGGLVASPSPLPSPKSPKFQAASKTKVAFVSVRKPIPSQKDENRLSKKGMASDWLATTATDKVDPFFSLLTGGHALQGQYKPAPKPCDTEQLRSYTSCG